MAKKKITESDLKKALEEGYSLGYKHGVLNKKQIGLLTPEVETELQIVALSKTLQDSSKKINKEILERHSDMVKTHLKSWSQDADKALKEIMETVHTHEDK